MIGPDGRWAYVTRRFDRVRGKDGAVQKRAMEDFGQLFDRVRDNDKYKGSYDQIGRLLRERSSHGLRDCANFFDQVFLSYLIGNNDFHLRNVSVFVAGNRPMLTPVYDFTITQLIDEEPDIDTTLSVNGKRARLRLGDWVELGGRMGLVPKAVQSRIGRIGALMPALIETVDRSFLPEDQREKLRSFMNGRLARVRGDGR